MKYAIKHPTDGYMYEDEDYLPGTVLYQQEIDEDFTLLFTNRKDAEFVCKPGDIVVAIENGKEVKD